MRRLLLFLLLVQRIGAQVPTPHPAFEVASVRLSTADHGYTTLSPSGAQEFRVTSVSMLFLIDMAFDMNPNQTTGAPAWAETTLYDVSAKPEGDAGLTYQQLRPLLQNLLRDRLHLQTHVEKRQVSGYALVVAKGGSKLERSPDGTAPTGSIFSEGLQSPSLPMAALAAMLANPLGSPVVDQTGLPGNFKVSLRYSALNSDGADPSLPSIFTAVTEQLGLRLIHEKVSVDFLVVDHVDRIVTAN